MISLDRILKDYRDSGALNALVNIYAAIDPRTFLTKSGDLVMLASIEGMEYECLDSEEQHQVARRFESAMRGFDERFRIYQYLIKSEAAPLPVRSYSNRVVNQAVESRRTFLRTKTAYSLRTYFAIVLEREPKRAGPSQLLARFMAHPRRAGEALSTDKAQNQWLQDLEHSREVLASKVMAFAVQLREFLPVEILTVNEGLGFLRRLLNYEPHVADSATLKYADFVDYQACNSHLECHRDHLRLDDYYVQVLTLKEPPARTFAHILKGLEDIKARYIVCSEWKRATAAAARGAIQTKRRHFYQGKTSLMNYVGSSASSGPKDMLIDDSAVAVVAELGMCLQEIEVGGKDLGDFSLTIVLYDKDPAALKRSVAECCKIFALHDAQLLQERYNQLNAWLSVIPGNAAYNLRRLWLTNTNYADLSFLFSVSQGDQIDRHLGADALASFETDSGVPYFFSLHDHDLAHTLILGATGSGKSFLLNFLITHAQKYQPFTFIFDLGGSYEMLTQLFGGTSLAIGQGRQTPTINPFCLSPSAENIQFLYAFFRVLAESSGYQFTASDERDLYEQIGNVYEVEPDQRRLYTLANIVNAHLREALQKWTVGGQYGSWFDHAQDTLTFARFQTFDFEGLSKLPQVLEPLLFYVLHRANAAIYDPSLGTTLKLFILDEAWRFFRHPTIKLYIVEALKTWRKRNAAVILATQSSEDLNSDLLPVVLESCPTRLFLANSGMDQNVYRELFHLNATEAERIASLVPKKQLLIKRPTLAKIVNLNVGPIEYWLYTNSPFDNNKKRAAFERYGLEKGLEILAGPRTSGGQKGALCH